MTSNRTGQTVAIHQPNFFPWLGYFDKIARCETFIFLDDVLLHKGAGSWSNRVKLLVSGEGRWATSPITRLDGGQTILETGFDASSPWRRKMLATLMNSYKKSAFFDEAMAVIEPLIENPVNNLAEYNVSAITVLAKELGFDDTRIVRSSNLPTTDVSTARLIELVNAVDGAVYLEGGGAEGYQEDSLFAEAGLRIEKQKFSSPIYPQHGKVDEFVPGLSIIDALMNVGFAGTRRLITQA